MANIIKRLQCNGLGREEVAYGTKSTQPVYFGVQSATVEISDEIILNSQGCGSIATNRSSRGGNKMATYTLTGIVESAFHGQFLYGALGTFATSADDPEAGANTHTASVLNTNQHPSYTLFFEDSNRDEVGLGCRMVSYQQVVTAGDYVTYTAVFIGQAPSTNTGTPSYTDSYLFSADQALIRLTTVGGSFTGTTIPLETLTFTINKNTEAYFAVGSTIPNNIINKNFSCDGSFTLLDDDDTYYDLFNDHTLQAMEISLIGDTNIGATSTPHSTKFTLNQMHFSTWDNNGALDDIVKQNIAFTCEKEDSITAELINGQANAVY
jgi:hypothetical protein